jgi:hypothetical protein
MSHGPSAVEPLELELALDAELVLEPEPTFEPELVLEAELTFEPELAFEPEPVLEPVLLPCWDTTVPVVVGLAVCGVHVSVFPETQYENFVPSEVVITPPEVVYVPLVDGLADTHPSPPVSWTVAEQLHPPLAASVQVTDE